MAEQEPKRNYILGIFGHENDLMAAVPEIRAKGVKIEEVYTSYPIHGLEHALGYKRSWLPKAAFFFGLLGFSLAVLMQTWMMGVDWPMIIGGKKYLAYPDFVPVSFEMTVLLAAFGMVFSMFISEGLHPFRVPKIFDRRATDDKHVMAIDLAANTLSEDEISKILNENKAEEVNKKTFTDEELDGSFAKYLVNLFTNGVTSSSRPLG